VAVWLAAIGDLLILVPETTRSFAAEMLPYLLILLIVFGTLGSPFIQSWIGIWSLRRGGRLMPQQFQLKSEAFAVKSELGDARLLWSGIPRVEMVRDRLFVFTTPKCAYIVPRRAFDSDLDFDGFVATVEKR
jgi:hypothetical protein